MQKWIDMTVQYCIYSFFIAADDDIDFFYGFCYAGDFNATKSQKFFPLNWRVFFMTKAFSLKISVGLAFHLNSRYGFEIPHIPNIKNRCPSFIK